MVPCSPECLCQAQCMQELCWCLLMHPASLSALGSRASLDTHSASLLLLQNQSAFLLVLDAESFLELGRAEVGVPMPYGFHGVFAAH